MTWKPRSPYSADALAANRERTLTSAQATRLRKVAKAGERNSLLAGIVIPIACVALVLGVKPGPPIDVITIVIGALVTVALLWLATPWGDPLQRDLRKPVLAWVDGQVSRSVSRSSSNDSSPTYTYRLHVANRTLRLERSEYEAAPNDGWFRVYYLPRSRHVVNLEPLSDFVQQDVPVTSTLKAGAPDAPGEPVEPVDRDAPGAPGAPGALGATAGTA